MADKLLLSSLVALGAALACGSIQAAEDAALVSPAWCQDTSFQRIATLANYRNLDAESIGEETVSEIVAVSEDGNLLVYTDSPGERIGFVDITDPRNPQPAGTLGVGGEPTSVDMVGDRYALAAVNTSESYTNASGKLVVVDVATRTIVQEIALDGQPDSIKVSPDDRYVAIAIENERDEEVEVEGVEGGLPQAPAGYLSIIDILGDSPADWQRRDVDLSGYAFYGSDDPEPEFVDINSDNDVVVSLQENNHILVVDLASGRVQSHFDAGTVDLDEVDATEDGVIAPTESISNIPREPDAIAWVAGSGAQPWLIATANEGDLFGGSRGFSLFDPRGAVVYDSGKSLEWQAIAHGHYPEDRSENKGIEPEAIDYGRFGNDDYLFVGSERGSFIGVYRMGDNGPEFEQMLPAPLAPEGVLAIPSRNLLVVTGESDDPSYGVRSSIMIYALTYGQPTYPQIRSDDFFGAPIPWSALSGMVALPDQQDRLLAVWDSYYSEGRIFTIDASREPAMITDALSILGGSGDYDAEGIAVAPDGTLWIASEGNASDSRQNRLLQVNAATGEVMAEYGLPAEILACRAASENRSTLGSGFEGLAILPEAVGYRLVVVQQRGWDYTTPECEHLDDDAGGLNANGEPLHTRVWLFNPSNQSWDSIQWELAALPEHASWVGLSEITRAPDGTYVVLERDNRSGDFAGLKSLVKVDAWMADDGLVSQGEKSVFDVMPALKATNGWITDKPEGVAITPTGTVFLVTDNDGVEDWSGETWFLNLGWMGSLFY